MPKGVYERRSRQPRYVPRLEEVPPVADIYAQNRARLDALEAPADVEPEPLIEHCPRCGEPMQCYGNLEGKIINMNPPYEDATWACHGCKLKRRVRRPVAMEENFELVKHYELLA